MIRLDTKASAHAFLINRKVAENSENNDLSKVKEISHKLQLSIKRRSVLQWKKTIQERTEKGFFSFSNPVSPEKDLLTIQESTFVSPQTQYEKCKFVSKKNRNIFQDRDTKLQAAQENISPLRKDESLTCQEEKNYKNLNFQNDGSCVTKDSNNKEDDLERRRRITDSLINIRKDLMLMRMEDHALARKLLNIRQAMNHQRATLMCDEHAAMLDDFSWEIVEEEELKEKHKLSDLSSSLLRRQDSLLNSSSVLHHMGINKRSMDFRRFSVV